MALGLSPASAALVFVQEFVYHCFFPGNETPPPWNKALVVKHNNMEGSGNEFGERVGSVHRSRSKERVMSLK